MFDRVSTSVRHLLPGDVLTTGETVVRRPFSQTRTPKNRVYVSIEKAGITVTHLWNSSTTITVLRERV